MARALQAEIARELDRAQERGTLLVCPSTSRSLRQALELLVARGQTLRLAPSTYARPSYWASLNPLERHVHLAKALAQHNPGWTFCRQTAAAILGLSPSYGTLAKIHVLAREGSRTRDTEMVAHHVSKDTSFVMHDGLRVTPPERTAFDCMRTMPFARALAVADAATRLNGWHDAHLAEYIERADGGRHDRGVVAARHVAAMVDGRAESGGESIARANMIAAGFKLPELQVEIENPLEPGTRYRADFMWLLPGEIIVIGELDGRQKYVDQRILGKSDTIDALLAERLRESRISAAGIKVARFSYSEACSQRTLARILDAYGIPRVAQCPQPHHLPAGIRRQGPGGLLPFNKHICLTQRYTIDAPERITWSDVLSERPTELSY